MGLAIVVGLVIAIIAAVAAFYALTHSVGWLAGRVGTLIPDAPLWVNGAVVLWAAAAGLAVAMAIRSAYIGIRDWLRGRWTDAEGGADGGLR